MTTNQKSSAAAGAAEDTNKDGGPAKVADTTATDLDAMRAELDAMRDQLAQQLAAVSAQASAQVPVPSESQEPTHVAVLACGDMVELPNTASSHHHCDVHKALVPVTSVFGLDPSYVS